MSEGWCCCGFCDQVRTGEKQGSSDGVSSKSGQQSDDYEEKGG